MGTSLVVIRAAAARAAYPNQYRTDVGWADGLIRVVETFLAARAR